MNVERDVLDALRQASEPLTVALLVQTLRDAHGEAAVLRSIADLRKEKTIVKFADEVIWLRGRDYN